MEPFTPPDMERYECITPLGLLDVPEVKQIMARESGADWGKLTIEGIDALNALVSLDAPGTIEAIIDVRDARDSKFSREMIFEI